MKAMIYTEYGTHDVLSLKEVPKPTPKADEVLVKVHASSINFADNAILTGEPFLVRLDSGLSKPKKPILGADVAGIVETIGTDVTQFKQGDAVYADLSACGHGAYAEYVAVPAKFLALKPTNLSFEEAAAIPLAGITALQGVRTAKIERGQKVLINGATGGVGLFTLQIAKSLGAEITAVCSTRNLDLVRSMGADHVIDYTQTDFTKGNNRYDRIIAVNGYHTLGDYKRALAPNGRYTMFGGKMRQIFEAMLLGSFYSMFGNKKLGGMGVAKPNQADLNILSEMAEAGQIRPVIDRGYPLTDLGEAFRYFVEQHPKGKIAISMM